MPDLLPSLNPFDWQKQFEEYYQDEMNKANQLVDGVRQYDDWRGSLDDPLRQLYDKYTQWVDSPEGNDTQREALKQLIELINSKDYESILSWISSHNRVNQFNTLDQWFGPGLEEWLKNQISKQQTESNRSWESEMRDTSLTSAANQLESLGLSASGVLQTGAASHNAVDTAKMAGGNNAHARLMASYNQKMAIAKELLGMTSSMASAGIYGGALGAAKKASSVVTSAASHSAYRALKSTGGPSRSEIMKMLGSDKPISTNWTDEL